MRRKKCIICKTNYVPREHYVCSVNCALRLNYHPTEGRDPISERPAPGEVYLGRPGVIYITYCDEHGRFFHYVRLDESGQIMFGQVGALDIPHLRLIKG